VDTLAQEYCDTPT